MVANLLRTGLLLLVLCGAFSGAQAQIEFSAWRFGQGAGLQFPFTPGSGPPTAVTSSSMTSIEGCASVADSVGNLQCYTDGEQVWNRLRQVMPNGRLFSGNSSNAAQGPMLLPYPGHSRQYLLFTVDAALSFSGGLRYSIIDMKQAGGNGPYYHRARCWCPPPHSPM